MLPRWAAPTLLAATIALPLAGRAIAGRELAELFQFPPPLKIPRDYPQWSWLACGLVLLPFLALGIAWLRRPARESRETPGGQPRHAFPSWGWLAVVWTFLWWVLAWTRWSWFAPLQRYTFFPLWLGFIIAVNALTHCATGTCLMETNRRGWLRLFAASAIFWWGFEWLNRFVHNWHYLAAEDFGALGYAVHATVCFSTVLPAVAAVAEWCSTRATLQARLAAGPVWHWPERRATGIAFVIGGAAALVLTGVWPLQFYAALWAAPLALLAGFGIVSRGEGLWSEVTRGDWRRIGNFALAALVCGFFWEMWNYPSLAKWIYTVPYTDRWHIFEMPALGYLGYLPFGLECLLVIEWLRAGPSGDRNR